MRRCPVDWRGEEGDCLETFSVPPSPPPRSMAEPCQSTEGCWTGGGRERNVYRMREEKLMRIVHMRERVNYVEVVWIML